MAHLARVVSVAALMTWLRLFAGNVGRRFVEWKQRGYVFGPALLDRIKRLDR